LKKRMKEYFECNSYLQLRYFFWLYLETYFEIKMLETKQQEKLKIKKAS
jgi:hypothetical protein